MKLHPSIQALVTEIDAFRSKTGMTASGFGRAAVGDPNFYGDLVKHGRMPSFALVDRVRDFMRKNAKAMSRESAA